MKKLIYALALLLIVSLTGCKAPSVDTPKTSTTPHIEMNEVLLKQNLVDQLSLTPLQLVLEKQTNDSPRLVAQIENRTHKKIVNTKVNVYYVNEQVQRILYSSQEVMPQETSQPFQILGPSSNEISDVEVVDVTISFEDDTQIVASDTPLVEPKDTPQVTVSNSKQREFEVYRFGSIIVEADDLRATLTLKEDQHIEVTFNNTTDYTILKYHLTFHDGQQEYTITYDQPVVAHSQSPIIASIATHVTNLDHVTIKALQVTSDYEENSVVISDFVLSDDITAKYEIRLK